MAIFACTLVSFSFMYANWTYMINVSVLCDTRNFGNLQQILKINIHIFEQIISPFFINETNNNVCMLADSGFFKNFLYQGGMKSTVS